MRLKRGGGGREGGKASLVFYGGRKIPYLVFTPPLPRSHGIATVVVVVRTEIYTRWWVRNIQRVGWCLLFHWLEMPDCLG